MEASLPELSQVLLQIERRVREQAPGRHSVLGPLMELGKKVLWAGGAESSSISMEMMKQAMLVMMSYLTD